MSPNLFFNLSSILSAVAAALYTIDWAKDSHTVIAAKLVGAVAAACLAIATGQKLQKHTDAVNLQTAVVAQQAGLANPAPIVASAPPVVLALVPTAEEQAVLDKFHATIGK